MSNKKPPTLDFVRDSIIQIKSELEAVYQGRRNFQQTSSICRTAKSLIDCIEFARARISFNELSLQQNPEALEYAKRQLDQELGNQIAKKEGFSLMLQQSNPSSNVRQIEKYCFLLRLPEVDNAT